MNEVWILGAAGRIGSTVAAALSTKQLSLVLLGRDAPRLHELAQKLGGQTRVVVARSLDEILAELARGEPSVVVNTIGPFTATALPIARACLPRSHYLDLSNDLPSVTALLGLHDEATASGRTLVTGAGFGVLATESVVLSLCKDQPPAARVRVDAAARIDGEGPLGATLAATLLDGLASGGRRYEGGQLVRAGYGEGSERLALPDGSTIVTGSVPSGDLEAARRASGAPSVLAASPLAPSNGLARVATSAFARLLSLRPLRRVLERRLAGLRVAPPAQRSEFSWGHARVQWPDGAAREGWMRAGEGMAFTANVAAEVALRLASGEGRPGAYTPGALFGAELAVKAGGQLLL